jgi:hypothetical protein
MPELIQKFSDGSKLEYDEGKFDSWGIWLTRPGQQRYMPRDVEYFNSLQLFGGKHGSQKIYADFVDVFEHTNQDVEQATLSRIRQMALKYGADSLEIEILLVILYAGMIAEENKENTRLGKRVKRLGVHQVLEENMSAAKAANFSRGMKAFQIADLCVQRGF